MRWLEEAEDKLDPTLTLWQARLLSRRGRSVDARALLERRELAEDLRGRDEILEAWCEVIAEEEAWGGAIEVADRAERYAAWAGVPPLDLYAARLKGRASAASGEPIRALELLTTALEGFVEIEAVWEAAVTRLDLARVLITMGEDERARSMAWEAVSVFEQLRSVRELSRARDLLGDPS
jgi:hypothetical protein